MGVRLRKDNDMGNFGKKLLGMGALGAAAGAAAYYFVKKKNENPDLQEEFADFQDNLKETAVSAAGVASKFKKVMEKSVDDAVSKVKEHTDDFLDDDIFEEEDFTEAAQALSDEEVEAAAGGGRDGGMDPIQLLSGTGYEFVKEHFPQYLDRCFPK